MPMLPEGGSNWRMVLAVAAVTLLGTVTPLRADVDFERDIRPVLVAKCFSCHDEKKQTAAYRLDLREVAFKGGESGVTAIVPGNPDVSELIERITTDDTSIRMPPKGDGLTASVPSHAVG